MEEKLFDNELLAQMLKGMDHTTWERVKTAVDRVFAIKRCKLALDDANELSKSLLIAAQDGWMSCNPEVPMPKEVAESIRGRKDLPF